MDEILHATPGNPVPENHFAGFFKGHKGVNLRYAVFRSEQAIAKGTIVLLHGRNEAIEKYFETIRDLTARGLWVATYDMRGQGGSDRLLKNKRRGHVRHFTDYVRDLEIFLEQIVLPDTRLPFFLLAHSTGGLVALMAAPKLANRIDRMVLTAPFVGLGPQPVSPRKVYLLSMLASWTGFGGFSLTADGPPKPFEQSPLTSDPARFKRNQEITTRHPELALGPPTARWLHECLKAMDRVAKPAHLYSITVPTVILTPTRDQVVSYSAQELMAQYYRAAQFVPIAGSRHEILQERNRYRAQALAAISAFIPGSAEEDENTKTTETSGA